jgi:CBS domain-containing protein
MPRAYPALPLSRVPAGAGFCAPEQRMADRVTADDPAMEVMTDLTRVSAVLVRSTDSIDEALSRMKQHGVRLLLVVDGERRLMGLITANDILGEKPMRHLEAYRGRHQDILVGHVMTPREELEAIPLASVRSAKVGHVVATLRESGRQHALVAEADGRIRGIFSATQIARQLGVDPQLIKPAELAYTFAQIETSLLR